MDLDSAKENIQPLIGGRDIHRLELVLNAEHDQEAIRILQKERADFGEKIKNYTGPDPLEPWIEYILWIEQSYPSGGKESGFDEALIKCIATFENDERYFQDHRMIKLYIKYIDGQTNPHEYYQELYNKGIGTMVADLYICWAYYHDICNSFEKVECIFRKGLDAKAQPFDELDQAHKHFGFTMSQRVLHKENYLNQEFMTTMNRKRQALTSLKLLNKNTGSIRTGSAVKSNNPGKIQIKNPKGLSQNNVQVSVFQDDNQDEDQKVLNTDEINSQPICSIISSARRQENIIEPGPWTKAKIRPNKANNLYSSKQSTSHDLGFEILEDDNVNDKEQFSDQEKNLTPITGAILPPNHVRHNKIQGKWYVQVAVELEPLVNSIPQYDKFRLYPKKDIVFSPEELLAFKYFKKQKINNNFVQRLEQFWGNNYNVGIRLFPNFVRKNLPQEEFKTKRYEYIKTKNEILCTKIDEIYPKDSDSEFQIEELLSKKFKRGERKLKFPHDETINIPIDLDETQCALSTNANKSLLHSKYLSENNLESKYSAKDCSMNLGLFKDEKMQNSKEYENKILNKFSGVQMEPLKEKSVTMTKTSSEIERLDSGLKVTHTNSDRVSLFQGIACKKTPNLSTLFPNGIEIQEKFLNFKPTSPLDFDATTKPNEISFNSQSKVQKSFGSDFHVDNLEKLSNELLPSKKNSPPKASESIENPIKIGNVFENDFRPKESEKYTIYEDSKNVDEFKIPGIQKFASKNTPNLSTLFTNENEIQEKFLNFKPTSPLDFNGIKKSNEILFSSQSKVQKSFESDFPVDNLEKLSNELLPSKMNSPPKASESIENSIKIGNVFENDLRPKESEKYTIYEDSKNVDEFKIPGIQKFASKNTPNLSTLFTNENEIQEKFLNFKPTSPLDFNGIKKSNEILFSSQSKVQKSFGSDFPVDNLEKLSNELLPSKMNSPPKASESIENSIKIGNVFENDFRPKESEKYTIYEDSKNFDEFKIPNFGNIRKSLNMNYDENDVTCSTQTFNLFINAQKVSTPNRNSKLKEITELDKENILPTIPYEERDEKEIFVGNYLSPILELTESNLVSSEANTKSSVEGYHNSQHKEFEIYKENINKTSKENINSQSETQIPILGAIKKSTIDIENKEILKCDSIKFFEDNTETIPTKNLAILTQDDHKNLFNLFIQSPVKNNGVNLEKFQELSLHIKDENISLENNHKSIEPKDIIFNEDNNLLPLDDNKFIYSMIDLNETNYLINEYLIHKSINPFDENLIKAFLDKIDFVNYISQLSSCTMVKKVNCLKKNMIIDINENRFEIIKHIGDGTFGNVYMGKDLATRKSYAFKYEKKPNLWEYYISLEIKSRIKNDDLLSGIMNVEYALIGNNASILVYNYGQFGSLIHVHNKIKQITSKNIDEYIVMILTKQMLLIMDHLHACRIIHADIKADNFVLMSTLLYNSKIPQIQLIDFGSAIDLDLFPQNQKFTYINSDQYFKCVEMRENKPWTFQLDLYGLAGSIHALLFGNYMEIQKHLTGWNIKTSFPRYMKKTTWNTIFDSLLNIPNFTSMPNLQNLRALLEEEIDEKERYVCDKISEFNNIILEK